MSKKNTVKKPVAAVSNVQIEVEEEIPSMPETPITTEGTATIVKRKVVDGVDRKVISQRYGDTLTFTADRIESIGSRIGFDNDQLALAISIVKGMAAHSRSLPADWKPKSTATPGAPRSGGSSRFEVNTVVTLREKFIAVFEDSVEDKEELNELTITKVLDEGKKVVVRTPSGDKLILGTFMIAARK